MTDLICENEILKSAIGLWRGDVESLRYVNSSDNQVYCFTESGATRYLRLTSSRDRTKEQIEAEFDFINYLRRGGINAMLPIDSVKGRLIEEIPVAQDFLFACVFEEAEGKRFKYDRVKCPKEHFRLRGKTLGQIHALSKEFVPSRNHRRFAWDEDDLILNIAEFLPDSEQIVWREFDKLKERLQAYPKSSQTYGLIHGDFGETNYRYQNEQLNIFDFDDCCYHWFIYDLAVTIYPHGWRNDALQLLDSLLEGYSENMTLPATLADITIFCRWRMFYMFLVYAQKWGFENLSQRQIKWFAQKRENIFRGYQWSV